MHNSCVRHRTPSQGRLRRGCTMQLLIPPEPTPLMSTKARARCSAGLGAIGKALSMIRHAGLVIGRKRGPSPCTRTPQPRTTSVWSHYIEAGAKAPLVGRTPMVLRTIVPHHKSHALLYCPTSYYTVHRSQAIRLLQWVPGWVGCQLSTTTACSKPCTGKFLNGS